MAVDEGTACEERDGWRWMKGWMAVDDAAALQWIIGLPGSE